MPDSGAVEEGIVSEDSDAEKRTRASHGGPERVTDR